MDINCKQEDKMNIEEDTFKYRIWDLDNKQFDYINLLDDIEKTTNKLDMIANYFWDNYLKDNSQNIQQCTGLRDKNNDLIYVGDVLEQPDGIQDVVKQDKGCYIHNGTAITNYDPCYQGDKWAKEVNTHLIVGHIYESKN